MVSAQRIDRLKVYLTLVVVVVVVVAAAIYNYASTLFVTQDT